MHASSAANHDYVLDLNILCKMLWMSHIQLNHNPAWTGPALGIVRVKPYGLHPSHNVKLP